MAHSTRWQLRDAGMVVGGLAFGAAAGALAATLIFGILSLILSVFNQGCARAQDWIACVLEMGKAGFAIPALFFPVTFVATYLPGTVLVLVTFVLFELIGERRRISYRLACGLGGVALFIAEAWFWHIEPFAAGFWLKPVAYVGSLAGLGGGIVAGWVFHILAFGEGEE